MYFQKSCEKCSYIFSQLFFYYGRKGLKGLKGLEGLEKA